MHWTAGRLPGGSAGTSFCKGSEISIRFGAMWARVGLSGLKVDQLRCGAAEDVGLLFVAQRGCRKNRIDRMHLPDVRVVAAQHDLAGADLRGQMSDRLRLKNQRVEIDLLEIFRRFLFQLDVGVAALGTDEAGVVRAIGVGAEITA